MKKIQRMFWAWVFRVKHRNDKPGQGWELKGFYWYPSRENELSPYNASLIHCFKISEVLINSFRSFSNSAESNKRIFEMLKDEMDKFSIRKDLKDKRIKWMHDKILFDQGVFVAQPPEPIVKPTS